MYQGRTRQVFKHALFILALAGIAAAVGLMGPSWPRFLSVASAVILPVLLLCVPLVRWVNRFSLDDGTAAIIKPGGKRIPYDRVREVLIYDRGDAIDLYARQGRFHTTALVQSLDRGALPGMRDELVRRLPGAVVIEKRRPWLVTALVVPAGLALLLAAAHGFLYHRYPAVRTTTRPLGAWTAVAKVRPQLQPRTRAGDFQFELPAGFAFIGKGEGTLSFEERSQKLRLEIITNIKRDNMARHAFWFRYGMGVRDFADLTAFLFQARYGVVPLSLRALALRGQEEVVLYETMPPLLRGYVTQGRRGREELTHVFLSGEGPGREMHLYASGPKRVPEEVLRSIITGIRLDHPSPSASVAPEPKR
jgi:hypothetical protein